MPNRPKPKRARETASPLPLRFLLILYSRLQIITKIQTTDNYLLFDYLFPMNINVFPETADIVEFFPAAGYKLFARRHIPFGVAGTVKQPTSGLAYAGDFSKFRVPVIADDVT